MPDVLHGVVGVDVQVARGPHGQVEAAVLAQLRHHVVEEGQAGGHADRAAPVEDQTDLDRSSPWSARPAGGPAGC